VRGIGQHIAAQANYHSTLSASLLRGRVRSGSAAAIQEIIDLGLVQLVL
jgi:hypothetical protein